MISSVIAKFAQPGAHVGVAIQEIAAHPQLEVGDLVDGTLLPVTIDAASQAETESTTQWLQSLDAVDFVDVVYVHFEDESPIGTNQSENFQGTAFDDEK